MVWKISLVTGVFYTGVSKALLYHFLEETNSN